MLKRHPCESADGVARRATRSRIDMGGGSGGYESGRFGAIHRRRKRSETRAALPRPRVQLFSKTFLFKGVSWGLSLSKVALCTKVGAHLCVGGGAAKTPLTHATPWSTSDERT